MNKAFITFICILNLVHVMIHLASSSKESTMIRDWHTIHFDTIRFGRVLPVTMIVSLPFFFFFDFFFDFFWFFFTMVRLIRIFSNQPVGFFLSFHGGPNSDNVVVKIPKFKAFRYLPTFTAISSTSTTDGAQSYVEVHHSCSHSVKCSSWTQVGTLGLPVGNCYNGGVGYCI